MEKTDMLAAKTAACDVKPLTGENITSAQINSVHTAQNDTLTSHSNQGFFGNKCGHIKSICRPFIPNSTHDARYVQLQDLIKDFHNSYYKRKKHQYLYYHLDEFNRPKRKIRSDFSELLASGSAMLMHYYDVLTGAIGFFDSKGRWVNILYKTLAKSLNVPLERIKRLFKHLKAKKFITIKRRARVSKSTGSVYSVASDKILNPSFIIQALGMDAWRKIQRLKAKLLKQKAPIKNEANKENIKMLNNIIGGTIKTTTQQIMKRVLPTHHQKTAAQETKNLQKAMNMHKQDPSCSLSYYLKQIINIS